MYIVPPLWSHILWLYWDRNDSELLLWHIRLGFRSVSPSDQSPCWPHEKRLGPYLPIAKFRGLSRRTVAECLREIAWSFSEKFFWVSPRNFAEKAFSEISDFYFFLEKNYFVQGVYRGETRKKKRDIFSGADLYIRISPTILCFHFD